MMLWTQEMKSTTTTTTTITITIFGRGFMAFSTSQKIFWASNTTALKDLGQSRLSSRLCYCLQMIDLIYSGLKCLKAFHSSSYDSVWGDEKDRSFKVQVVPLEHYFLNLEVSLNPLIQVELDFLIFFYYLHISNCIYRVKNFLITGCKRISLRLITCRLFAIFS